MLTEVDHRILNAVDDLRCLNDVWKHIQPAWKHGDVTKANPIFTDSTPEMETRTFRLDHPMHSLEIDQALARQNMRPLNQKWFAHLLFVRNELPEHPFLIALGCLFPDRWSEPRILFTEAFFHQAIQSKFGIHLRRFDYNWPIGTLVPAMPLLPEVT